MSKLIKFTFSVNSLFKQNTIRQIVSTNAISRQYNLTLTEADAEQILEARHMALKDLGRIEMGTEVISQLIRIFCCSPFINQNNYVATIIDLIEAFYYLKNETRDEIGDMELIELMKECFDNRCFGSTELLIGQELEGVIQAVRQGRYYGTLSCDEDEVR